MPPFSFQVQAQLQLDSAVAHAQHHLHSHLAAHAPYMMFPAPPFGLPLATLAAESASAASVVAAAAAAKNTSKNSSIADLRLKAKKHAAALGLWRQTGAHTRTRDKLSGASPRHRQTDRESVMERRWTEIKHLQSGGKNYPWTIFMFPFVKKKRNKWRTTIIIIKNIGYLCD